MQSEERGAYHHGNLRTALLDGARAMLEERGADGFSLSALARRIGVSTAAPYRHFADREDLLCAIADEGYARFGERLRAAAEDADGAQRGGADEAAESSAVTMAAPGSTDARAALHRVAVAYLRFAEEEEPVFRIMFRYAGGRAPSGPPTFGLLVDVVRRVQATGALPADQPAPLLARAIWSALHGAAVLRARGAFRTLDVDVPREDLAAQTIGAFLR